MVLMSSRRLLLELFMHTKGLIRARTARIHIAKEYRVRERARENDDELAREKIAHCY